MNLSATESFEYGHISVHVNSMEILQFWLDPHLKAVAFPELKCCCPGPIMQSSHIFSLKVLGQSFKHAKVVADFWTFVALSCDHISVSDQVCRQVGIAVVAQWFVVLDNAESGIRESLHSKATLL